MINTAFAYTLLQALPGNKTEVSGLSDYLSWLFTFALAAAAFLAVLQIVIGGLQIISGGASETARSNAKKRIQDALWGLLLAFGAVLILETISPGQFTNLNLSITPVTIKAPAPSSGGGGGTSSIPGATANVYSNNTAKSLLESAGYRITSSGNCSVITNKNCTSLEGIPKSTVDKLITIANDFRATCSTCDLAITGGTETGHSEHGWGLPVVDLGKSSTLDNFLQANKEKYGIIKIIDSPHGTGPHIHVVFNL